MTDDDRQKNEIVKKKKRRKHDIDKLSTKQTNQYAWRKKNKYNGISYC